MTVMLRPRNLAQRCCLQGCPLGILPRQRPRAALESSAGFCVLACRAPGLALHAPQLPDGAL